MWINYHAFLAIAFATHAIVGYVLGSVLFGNPEAGVVGALAADIDFLFPGMLDWPFVHRGITHSILLCGLLTAAVAVCYRGVGGDSARVVSARALAGGFSVAYLSHLLIDSTTPKGLPLLYPLVDHSFYLDLPTTGHSPLPTALLILLSLGALYSKRTRAGIRAIEPDD